MSVDVEDLRKDGEAMLSPYAKNSHDIGRRVVAAASELESLRAENTELRSELGAWKLAISGLLGSNQLTHIVAHIEFLQRERDIADSRDVELNELRAESAEMRDCVDWKRKSLEQEIVGTLRAYGHWCPDSGADVITAVGLALSAHCWRPMSEPPEDEEEYVEVVDERLSIELRPWWTVAVDLEEGNHSWTHYRRFVPPGEE